MTNRLEWNCIVKGQSSEKEGLFIVFLKRTFSLTWMHSPPRYWFHIHPDTTRMPIKLGS